MEPVIARSHTSLFEVDDGLQADSTFIKLWLVGVRSEEPLDAGDFPVHESAAPVHVSLGVTALINLGLRGDPVTEIVFLGVFLPVIQVRVVLDLFGVHHWRTPIQGPLFLELFQVFLQGRPHRVGTQCDSKEGLGRLVVHVEKDVGAVTH